MRIQAELAVSPLAADFEEIIDSVIRLISQHDDIQYTVQPMSTLIIGEQNVVMTLVNDVLFSLFKGCKAMVNVTFSNACPETCEWK